MSKKIETEFGTAKIYNGYYMITSKRSNSEYLHRLIFEKYFGRIPDGFHIHHKDGDKLNNCIMNLELLSGSEHNSLHMKGKNNPMFNSCIKIRKHKNKKCKQGYTWGASPHTNDKQIHISSTDINKCIKKVQEFIKSERNDYSYTSYEVITCSG